MFPAHSFSLLAVTAVLGLATALPAQAQPMNAAPHRLVRINDLDLHTAAGAQTLRHRVDVAARQVCGPAETLGSTEYSSYDACVSAAQSAGRRQAETLITAALDDNRYADAAAGR